MASTRHRVNIPFNGMERGAEFDAEAAGVDARRLGQLVKTGYLRELPSVPTPAAPIPTLGKKRKGA